MADLTKAYHFPDLLERMKGKGLDLAEEAGKIVVKELFTWLGESAKLSKTPYDDMGLIVLPQLEAFALGIVDKADGQVG